jgi:hypothetical protein
MLRVDCDHMLINMILMSVVQVSIMKVVRMSFMLDSGVPAFGTVLMRVFFVNTTWLRHCILLVFHACAQRSAAF